MKLASENLLLAQAEQALRTCLADVPFCVLGNVEMPDDPTDAEADLEMGITIGKVRRRLLVQVRNSGQPRVAPNPVVTPSTM